MIKKVGSKYELRSKDGKKKLGGPFDTRQEAVDREKEIRGFSSRSLVDVTLSITKASLLKDGTMRFSAICSDIEPDSRGEQTTTSLFNDWTNRIVSQSKVGFLPNPKMPFLGIAHYPSLDGIGEAGKIEKSFVDGDKFKIEGRFHNDDEHPCGAIAFRSVESERELVNKGDTVELPLRISAAWCDLEHSHGDFVFTRKSLAEKCPMCEQGQPRTFLKGQLDHMAITRHPIHPRTDLQLMSENGITRKDDAISIVGKELAELLEKAAKPVKRSEPETVSLAHLDNNDTWAGPLGGATSFEEAENFLEAEETERQVFSNFDMFMMIMEQIKRDPELDKITAMEKALTDFGSRISALKSEATDSLMLSKVKKGEVVMTNGNEGKAIATDVHPADAFKQVYDATLGNESLNRSDKLQAFQEGINILAKDIEANVDIVAPVPVAEQLSQAMVPVVNQLELIAAKIGTQQAANTQPVQRSHNPGSVMNPALPKEGASSLTKMIRKSVGIVGQ